LEHGSSRESSKRTTDLSENLGGEALKDVFKRGSKSYVELDDLVVDEKTGRVTASTPESLGDVPEHHVPDWPV
jgi:hypothetical protein